MMMVCGPHCNYYFNVYFHFGIRKVLASLFISVCCVKLRCIRFVRRCIYIREYIHRIRYLYRQQEIHERMYSVNFSYRDSDRTFFMSSFFDSVVSTPYSNYVSSNSHEVLYNMLNHIMVSNKYWKLTMFMYFIWPIKYYGNVSY